MYDISLQTGNEVRPEYQLYSRKAIALATTFGSVLAGSFLIASNLKKLDRSEEVMQAYVFSLIFFVSLMLLAIKVPLFEKVPDYIFHLFQVGITDLYARYKFDPELKEHNRNKGAFYSNWRALGISLLITPIAVALLFGIIYLDKSKVDFGNGQFVVYKSDATKAEAQRLGEYLTYMEYFGDDTPAEVIIRKTNDVITVSFILINEAWTYEKVIGAFLAMRQQMDKQVFPEYKVCFELCDTSYEVKKTLTH